MLQTSCRRELPPTVAVTCVVCERCGDETSNTYPYAGYRRDAVSVVAPENGMIVAAGTYTGRLPSAARKNCGVGERLRSVTPYRLVPSEYEASTLAL